MGRTIGLVGGQDDMGHLQLIMASIGNFCMIGIGIFIVAEILVM